MTESGIILNDEMGDFTTEGPGSKVSVRQMCLCILVLW